MKIKLLAVILLAGIILAAITFTAARNGRPAAEPSAREHAEGGPDEHEKEAITIAGLKTEPAEVGEGWDAVTLTGRVTALPNRMVKISPRIEGKVVAAYGTVGGLVLPGQTLVLLSSMELAEARAEYHQAQAALQAAQQNHDREAHLVQLGAVRTRPVEEARAGHLEAQSALAESQHDLLQAKGELTQGENELGQCRARLQRARELYRDEIVSKQDLEAAEGEFRRDSAAVEAAQSKVGAAVAKLNHMQAKADVSKQYREREERLYKGRALDLRALQSVRAELSAARIRAQAAADKIRVLGAAPGGSGETIAVASPIAGRIVARTANIGEMASPSDALFTVADLSEVLIEADAHEKDIARLRPGQTARVEVDAYPGRTFLGHVQSVPDILTPESRTAKVRCLVPNPHGLLKGEMFARATIITGKRPRAILIPRQAVLDEAGLKVVFFACNDCKEDKRAGKSVCGTYDKAEVELGPAHNGTVEVLAGMEAGAQVVTVGQHQLKSALGAGKLEAGCADEE